MSWNGCQYQHKLNGKTGSNCILLIDLPNLFRMEMEKYWINPKQLNTESVWLLGNQHLIGLFRAIGEESLFCLPAKVFKVSHVFPNSNDSFEKKSLSSHFRMNKRVFKSSLLVQSSSGWTWMAGHEKVKNKKFQTYAKKISVFDLVSRTQCVCLCVCSCLIFMRLSRPCLNFRVSLSPSELSNLRVCFHTRSDYLSVHSCISFHFSFPTLTHIIVI